MKNTIIYLCTLFFFTCLAIDVAWSVQVEEGVEEKHFLSEWTKDSILKKEIIIGGTWSDEKSEVGGRNSIGIEYQKNFANETGDWGSFFLQLRLDRSDRPSDLVGGTHDYKVSEWKIHHHDAYFKYIGPWKGKLHLRAGAFQVPFGLEPNVDTHSTLIQLMPMRNVGFKRDWGVSAGGQLAEMDYEFALTRGSGMDYRAHGKNYLVSGRIGTPADRNFVIGLSGLYGQVIDSHGVHRGEKMGSPDTWFGSMTEPEDNIIRRSRIGLDCIYLTGPYTFKGELSYGNDEDQKVVNSLLEIDYLFPDTDGRLEGIAQIQNSYEEILAAGSDDDTFLTLGLNYRLTPEMTLQTVYRHDFQRFKQTENDHVIATRLYIYF